MQISSTHRGIVSHGFGEEDAEPRDRVVADAIAVRDDRRLIKGVVRAAGLSLPDHAYTGQRAAGCWFRVAMRSSGRATAGS